MIQFDEHIFQMGWFNHHPVKIAKVAPNLEEKKNSTFSHQKTHQTKGGWWTFVIIDVGHSWINVHRAVAGKWGPQNEDLIYSIIVPL